jgi:hypothetical protein
MPKFDLAIERDPNKGGSYRRRLNDVFIALKKLEIDKLRDDGAFIFYYLACEKIARIMIGITNRKPGPSHFNSIQPRSSNILKACTSLTPEIPKKEIESIFRDGKLTACRLRDQLVHDIGPTHVEQIVKNSPHLNGIMRRFIKASQKAIIDHLG